MLPQPALEALFRNCSARDVPAPTMGQGNEVFKNQVYALLHRQDTQEVPVAYMCVQKRKSAVQGQIEWFHAIVQEDCAKGAAQRLIEEYLSHEFCELWAYCNSQRGTIPNVQEAQRDKTLFYDIRWWKSLHFDGHPCIERTLHKETINGRKFEYVKFTKKPT